MSFRFGALNFLLKCSRFYSIFVEVLLEMVSASPAFLKRVTQFDSYRFADNVSAWALPQAITADGSDSSRRGNRCDTRTAFPSVRLGLYMSRPACRRVVSHLSVGNMQEQDDKASAENFHFAKKGDT